MKIACLTLFDCTATGITGHYRVTDQPLIDRQGQPVTTQHCWNLKRNQQRNWETLLQVIGLRCQLEDLHDPVQRDLVWRFEFTVNVPDVLGEQQEFRPLLADCEGVPMITGLEEGRLAQPMLRTHGPDQNIWFQTVNTAFGD